MTREDMIEWSRKLNMGIPDDDFIDRMYYLVALGIKQEREECIRDIDNEAETWGASSPVKLACGFIKQAIKSRGMQ